MQKVISFYLQASRLKREVISFSLSLLLIVIFIPIFPSISIALSVVAMGFFMWVFAKFLITNFKLKYRFNVSAFSTSSNQSRLVMGEKLLLVLVLFLLAMIIGQPIRDTNFILNIVNTAIIFVTILLIAYHSFKLRQLLFSLLLWVTAAEVFGRNLVQAFTVKVTTNKVSKAHLLLV